jgi:hypothetical protein
MVVNAVNGVTGTNGSVSGDRSGTAAAGVAEAFARLG